MFIALFVRASAGNSSFQMDPGLLVACLLGIVLLAAIFWLKQRHRNRNVGLRCPSCGDHRVRRSRTRGWGEQLLKSMLFHPYRCRDCDHRFWAFWKQ